MFSTVVAHAAVAALLSGTMWYLPSASAEPDSSINGTYAALSDGLWAKTNERFHDEVTVVSIWTISSSCSDYEDCTGTVVSDQGWSAPVRYRSGLWRLTRTIPHWQTCPDGTTAPGEQAFEFSRASRNGSPSTLTGFDRTKGPSGACGVNQWLTISMPFSLTLIS